MSQTLLVVEDDQTIARTLRISLRAHGYRVLLAADGATALQAVAEDGVDLVLLDLGLPDVDGIEVLRRVRAAGHALPVVVLSARRESDDKVEALDEGADDYVTKPFGMEELLARVRAALRRAAPPTSAPLGRVAGEDLQLDFDAFRATVLRDGGWQEVHLTPTEWRMLQVLAAAGGRVVGHVELLQGVWGPGYGRESNYLRVYSAQLRRKLEADPARPRHVVTEPGLGYSLRL